MSYSVHMKNVGEGMQNVIPMLYPRVDVTYSVVICSVVVMESHGSNKRKRRSVFQEVRRRATWIR
jgi:hypothetical protein